jgi:N-acetylmuramoyl-L-alanine amidase
MKICLDAGHFGEYNRSTVNPAYWESKFSWKFHLLLKAELEKYGIEVITTRTDQAKDLDLVQRGRKSAGCDLFLSIHSNACGDANADYPLACCCVNGSADVIGYKLAEIVGKCMGSSGKARIWQRTGNGNSDYYGVLRGAAAVGVPGILLEHGFHTNLKNTNWLLDDANLQKMAVAEAKVIAEHFGVNATDVTAKKSEIASSASGNATDATAKHIWDKLISAGLSEAGAAGLMGNLKAESNLQANNLQNSFESKLGYSDSSYTSAVDSGTYKNFADDGAGYGLAQWTFHTRKAALLAFAKEYGKSVGDLDLQLDFLLKELLESYSVLFGELRTAVNVRTASDAVLVQFERPSDMSASVKQKRAGFGEAFLTEFGGKKTDDIADVMCGMLTINGKTYQVTLVEC